MFNGDWQNAGLRHGPARQRRLLRLPAAEAGRHGRRDVGAADLRHRGQAKNADCAAFFLNWVATNETAREIDVDRRRLRTRAARPTCRSRRRPTARSTNETLAAGADVARDNGAMDFIANATGSIFAQGWTPELQKLVGGKQDAAGLLKAVQAQYETELNQLSRAADEAGRGRRSRRSSASDRSSAAGPADPLDSGDPPANRWSAGCSWSRPSSCTACSSCSRSS